MFSLRGKVAIVTGAVGLIGKSHCAALAEAGASVVVADLDLGAAEAVAARLPGRHLAVSADVTDKASLEAARVKIIAAFGSVDVLVNNAAANDRVERPDLSADLSRFENFPLETWRKNLDVSVTGVYLASQVFGTPMAEKRSGSIINIASTYGMVGPDQSIYRDENGQQRFYKGPAYPTCKGAVLNFTRYLAAYWGPQGVRVNSLSPGGVNNGQDAFFIQNYSRRTLLGRMATPDDYRGAIVFLASDASSYMTGANLVVDGGWTAI